MKKNNKGYVYILKFPNCECIKIGGTDFPPLKRIKEINITEPYKSLGPWSLSDFRQVIDWRKVEYNLHYKFRSSLNTKIEQQIELNHYETVLPRAASLLFEGTFQEVLVLLSMDGVRRALIAYWNEALIKMAENNKMGAYERFHNYNAVAKIVDKMNNT